MKKVAFYDTKPYDKTYFDEFKQYHDVEIEYFETKLNAQTAVLAHGKDAAVAFVNDDINAETIKSLHEGGVGMLAMRCSGYNNVDIAAAKGLIKITRVPDYSAFAIAEHTMALLLTLVRKTHKAYLRTREYNFSLNGLSGFDLHGKTIGIVGTGKIGRVFIDICKGFGMNVIAYDVMPSYGFIEYVPFEELCRRSDIISLHCPLTKDTHHIVNKNSIELMKDGVYVINTSRGALIDSEALLSAIKSKKIGAAGLDVYEEENEFFYEDLSNTIITDDILSLLISMPNVLVTSHQAFLTKEALRNIAATTFANLNEYFSGKKLTNEIIFQPK